MNESGVVDTADLMTFNDDAAAMSHAREMYHVGRVEVWAGKRQVAIVPPAINRRAAPDRRTR